MSTQTEPVPGVYVVTYSAGGDGMRAQVYCDRDRLTADDLRVFAVDLLRAAQRLDGGPVRSRESCCDCELCDACNEVRNALGCRCA